jgi:disulfide bond formation protein DsbB
LRVTGFAKARAAALIIPGALMAGALGSQYIGGLVPCEMCMWQRWPHYAAIGLAALAFVVPQRALVWLTALAILISGGIGVFHAGVEYHWWEGLTQCSQVPGSGGGGDILANIMKTPMVRCDEAQWTLFGISLAGYNAIVSIGGALLIMRLLMRKS